MSHIFDPQADTFEYPARPGTDNYNMLHAAMTENRNVADMLGRRWCVVSYDAETQVFHCEKCPANPPA